VSLAQISVVGPEEPRLRAQSQPPSCSFRRSYPFPYLAFQYTSPRERCRPLRAHSVRTPKTASLHLQTNLGDFYRSPFLYISGIDASTCVLQKPLACPILSLLSLCHSFHHILDRRRAAVCMVSHYGTARPSFPLVSLVLVRSLAALLCLLASSFRPSPRLRVPISGRPSCLPLPLSISLPLPLLLRADLPLGRQYQTRAACPYTKTRTDTGNWLVDNKTKVNKRH
jgi:hypothetical protein